MFASRYFGDRYFGPRYFGKSGADQAVVGDDYCQLLINAAGDTLAVNGAGEDLAISDEICVTEINKPIGGGRVYPYLPENKNKPGKVHRQPLPEYEVSGPLSRDRKLEHFTLPKWDVDQFTASLKTLETLEKEDRINRKKRTQTLLLLTLLD